MAGPALSQARRGTCPGPPLAQGPYLMSMLYNLYLIGKKFCFYFFQSFLSSSPSRPARTPHSSVSTAPAAPQTTVHSLNQSPQLYRHGFEGLNPIQFPSNISFSFFRFQIFHASFSSMPIYQNIYILRSDGGDRIHR